MVCCELPHLSPPSWNRQGLKLLRYRIRYHAEPRLPLLPLSLWASLAPLQLVARMVCCELPHLSPPSWNRQCLKLLRYRIRYHAEPRLPLLSLSLWASLAPLQLVAPMVCCELPHLSPWNRQGLKLLRCRIRYHTEPRLP